MYQSAANIGTCHVYKLHTKFNPKSFLLGLILYAEEIIGDYHCGFRRKRLTTDHMFCISVTLREKWE